jgi:hypothetical protein
VIGGQRQRRRRREGAEAKRLAEVVLKPGDAGRIDVSPPDLAGPRLAREVTDHVARAAAEIQGPRRAGHLRTALLGEQRHEHRLHPGGASQILPYYVPVHGCPGPPDQLNGGEAAIRRERPRSWTAVLHLGAVGKRRRVGIAIIPYEHTAQACWPLRAAERPRN